MAASKEVKSLEVQVASLHNREGTGQHAASNFWACAHGSACCTEP